MDERIKKRAPGSRLLLWSFLVSLAFHLLAGPLLTWLLGARLIAAQQREQQAVERITMTSSAVRLERRPRPRAPVPIVPPEPQAEQPTPPQPQRLVRQPKQPPRKELARINPRAEISVPQVSTRHANQSASLSSKIAAQEELYARTIEKLRRQNDPIISAARPMPTPAAPKRYVYDFSGSIGSPMIGQGILIPLKDWRDGPFDYYYVRYWVIYPDGTNETGIVPWPVRFLANNDPIKQDWPRMPLPGPLPDYVLPPDTPLHPLVAFCFKHRFASCPIYHD